MFLFAIGKQLPSDDHDRMRRPGAGRGPILTGGMLKHLDPGLRRDDESAYIAASPGCALIATFAGMLYESRWSGSVEPNSTDLVHFT